MEDMNSCDGEGVIIPYNQLSREALNGLIEEFVTRVGSDNGYDFNIRDNVQTIIRQLTNREAMIVFDQNTQTANIVSKEYFRIMSGNVSET